jgi:excisionase family DNA binding protein
VEELPKRELLTIAEVAEFFRVTQQTIYLWIDHGLLVAEKYRRVIRVTKTSVDSFRLRSRVNPEEKYK